MRLSNHDTPPSHVQEVNGRMSKCSPNCLRCDHLRAWGAVDALEGVLEVFEANPGSADETLLGWLRWHIEDERRRLR